MQAAGQGEAHGCTDREYCRRKRYVLTSPLGLCSAIVDLEVAEGKLWTLLAKLQTLSHKLSCTWLMRYSCRGCCQNIIRTQGNVSIASEGVVVWPALTSQS